MAPSNKIPQTLRATIMKHGAVPRETLTVPTPDGDLILEVRGLSSGARGRLLNDVMIDSEDGSNDDRRIDLGKLYPMLVIECAFDLETGERIFSAADFDVVSELSAIMLDPIATCASRISGLGDKSLKEAEKSLSAQPGEVLPVQPSP